MGATDPFNPFAPGFTNPESSLPSLLPPGRPYPGQLLPGIDYVPGQDFVGVPTAPVINPITGLIEAGPGYVGPSPIVTIGPSGYQNLNPTVGPLASGSDQTGFAAALRQLLGYGVAPQTGAGVYSTAGTQTGGLAGSSPSAGLSSTAFVFLIIAGLVLALK